MIKEVAIGNVLIGDQRPCFVIAEIGVNFDGDLGRAKESIDAAVSSGADAVKFQTFQADEFVANENLTYTYLLADGRKVTESQFEMFKRLELPDEWHSILQDHANAKGVPFLSSVADKRAVDLLEDLDVPALKIASEDLVNVDLLSYVAEKDRPVILSTGMATLGEIEGALEILQPLKTKLILLHCVSVYPTPLEACNLRQISALRQRFGVPVGFSDHTIGSDAAILAVALKSCVIEKHFTLDHHLQGPDHRLSMNPEQFDALVNKIRQSEMVLGDSTISYSSLEEECRVSYRRGIVAGRDIEEGEGISGEMLRYKRPQTGLKPYERELILGKKARTKILKNHAITLSDVK